MKLFIVCFLFVTLNITNAQTDIWQPVNGPYVDGGYARAISINSDGIIIVGFEEKGLYRSTDNGNNWALSGLNDFTITSIEKISNGDLFASTYDAIYKSTNKGIEWIKSNGDLPPLTTIMQIKADNQGIIYIATSDGLFRSNDYGTTWVKIQSANVEKAAIATNGFLYTIANSILYKSVDDGISWKPIQSGLPKGRVLDINIDPSNNLFISYNPDSWGSVEALYKSDDNGENWTSLRSFGPFYSIVITSSGELLIPDISSGLYRSTDHGSTWTNICTGLKDVRIIDIVSNSSGQLFAASNGVRSSLDNGITWVKVGPSNTKTEITSLAINSNGYLFAGSRNYGLFRSTNNGADWIRLTTGLNGLQFSCLSITSTGRIYAGSYGYGIFSSSDNGDSWKQINSNTEVSCMAVGTTGVLFAGGGNGTILRSTDQGSNWSSLKIKSTDGISSITISKSGAVYLGTFEGVFVSTDQGDNWRELVNSLQPYSQTIGLAVTSKEDIFAEYMGYGIYRSTDQGNSWTQSSSNVWSPIMSLVVNSNDQVFAAAANGVFRSTNNGEDWVPHNSGLNEYNSVNILVLDKDNYLWAGTRDRSVYKTRFISTAIKNSENVPSTLSLSQNYPNPFNPSTTIRYSIPSVETHHSAFLHTTLKVYDMLGREVVTLVNEEKSPGNYEIKFDGSNLSSGVYYYRLQIYAPWRGGSFSETKKFVLMK
jgi:photosystem II stability/assembly factor-like uncharacterized protein